MKRVMRILGAAGLLAAPLTAAARERPDWLDRTPADTAVSAYFVGQAMDAQSVEDGLEAAYRNAAVGAAKYINTQVGDRFLSQRTTLEKRIGSDIRASSRANLRGVRVRERYEQELKPKKRGAPARFFVAVLIEYPMAEVRSERRRLEEANREFAQRQDELCLALSRKLASARPGASVHVGKFLETTTGQRSGFSGFLEDGLRSCLAEKGVNVTASGPAELALSGTFWKAGHVEVSAVVSDASGKSVAARTVRMSLDAVEPFWVGEEDADADGFFSQPGTPIAPRAHGSISVFSEPRGAEIIVDGVSRGLTPSTILGLESGPRTVQLSLDGYVPQEQEVQVAEGNRPQVRLTLLRKTGTLSIHSLPEGAYIRLDGKVTGKTPSRLSDIPIGSHEISLTLREHKLWSRTVEIESEKVTALDPELVEEDGSLSILVEPAGARILLDSVHVGDSQPGRALSLKSVASGPHTVRAEMEGREPREWNIRVRPSVTASVTGALPAAASPEPYRAPKRSFPKISLPKVPSLDRPEGMYYMNLFGASFNGDYRNLRFLEAAIYGYSSTVGLGTSLVEMTRVKGWKTTRTPVAVAWYQTGSSNPAGKAGFDMMSIFPIKLYLAPLVHAYHYGDNEFVASIQLYSTFCFWALPSIDGLSKSNDNKDIPAGSVIDLGALVHLGPAVGLRMGVVEARFPKFAYGGDSYSGFHDRKVYFAADVSLGAFFPKR